MKASFKRVGASVLAAAAITGGLGVVTTTAGAGSASATQIYDVGIVQGHRAFAIGPYSSKAACQPRANILTSHGAKRYGSLFGECYYKNGSWWARSPWYA